MERKRTLRIMLAGYIFGALFVFPFYELRAQDGCFSLAQCVKSDGEIVGSELVPQTHLATCEDHKAKALATPGLILAERKSLVAASECEGAMGIFAMQLTASNLELGKEREGRINAESRVLLVGVVVALVSVLATLASVLLVKAFD